MTSRLKVYAGSQSDVYNINTASTTEPIAALSVTLNASTNPRTSDSGKLSYSSDFYKFIFEQEKLNISFRVGAAVDLAKGLYYIDWTIDVNEQSGASNTYNPPQKTLVEVIAKTVG